MIATARLRLRALTLDDVGALHAIHSRDDIVRWLYWDAMRRAAAPSPGAGIRTGWRGTTGVVSP